MKFGNQWVAKIGRLSDAKPLFPPAMTSEAEEGLDMQGQLATIYGPFMKENLMNLDRKGLLSALSVEKVDFLIVGPCALGPPSC